MSKDATPERTASELMGRAEMFFRDMRDASSADRSELWRELKTEFVSVLAAAEARGAERERERCAQACVNEYARWKDAEPDNYGIAISAIGAASNILCAIERIPCAAADSLTQEGEKTDG